MPEPDWNDLKVILALHRGGSVAAAARTLSVDPSTVSRRLSAIEGAMGTILLNRGGREFHFTDAGRTAVAAAEAMEAAMSEATLAVRSSRMELAGIVRIACPPSIVHFLEAFEPLLSDAHPGLAIELLSGRAPSDLSKGEADIGIRSLGVVDLDLVVAHRFDLGSCVYASDEYLSEHGAPDTPSDLRTHRLVRYGQAFLHLPAFNWIEDFADPAGSAVRVDSIDMARSLVSGGRGIGALYCAIGDRTPGISRVFEDPIDQMECAVVYHRSARGSARIRAVLDLLIGYFARRRHDLSGRRADA
jgi:DNA-binding transcriptional LysR family regulator